MWVQRGVNIPHLLVPIRMITLIIICEQVLIIILICNLRHILIGLEKRWYMHPFTQTSANFGIFLCPKLLQGFIPPQYAVGGEHPPSE
jgi:hypothetical protein